MNEIVSFGDGFDWKILNDERKPPLYSVVKVKTIHGFNSSAFLKEDNKWYSENFSADPTHYAGEFSEVSHWAPHFCRY